MNSDFSTQADDWVVISQSLIDSIFRVISSPGYIWIPFMFSLAIWIFTQRTRKSEQNSPTLALISSTGECQVRLQISDLFASTSTLTLKK